MTLKTVQSVVGRRARGLAAAARWLFGPGYLFMTATDERIAAQPAETFRRGWFSLMLLAAVWGLASMWLWQGGQEVFYDIRRRYRVEAAAWLTVAAMIATMAL